MKGAAEERDSMASASLVKKSLQGTLQDSEFPLSSQEITWFLLP